MKRESRLREDNQRERAWIVAEHGRVRLEKERAAEQDRLRTLQAEIERESQHRGVTGRAGTAGGVAVCARGAIGSAEGGSELESRRCSVGATGGAAAFIEKALALMQMMK